MKKKILIIQFLLLCNLLFSQNEKTEKLQRSKIGEMKTSVYFGDDEKAKTIYIKKFDENGNIFQELTFTDSILHSKFEYKYDKNNNKTLTIENGKKNLKHKYHYKYNSQNLITEHWNNDFLDKYYYDSNNRIYKMIHTNKESKETKEILFKYDDNGNKIAEYVEGNPFHLNQYFKYNSDNLIIECEIFYHNENKNELFSKFSYLYDENKNLINENFIDGYATENDIIYTYDQNGNLKSKEKKGDFLTTYYYNELNILIKKEKIFTKINMKITEVYEYKFSE